MLHLYHSPASSNSQRVRIVLEEKGVPWESHLMQGEELQEPAFRTLSPTGTIPVLVHDGRALTDSIVINEYLEECFPVPALRPGDAYAAARLRQWTKHADDYLQSSIAIFTHALVRRPVVLQQHDGNVDAAVAKLDDPIILGWRRSVYAEGLASPHVRPALALIQASLARLDGALQHSVWLVENTFSLADVALLPALFRLECLAMDFLWTDRYPAVQNWLARGKDRGSFQRAVAAALTERTLAAYLAAGTAARATLQSLANL